jgi:shikimate kinase
MRYFLIGYKSSGKSTMGRKLAKRIGMRFVDLDEVIEFREGKPIPELYTELGDEQFRIREWQALKEVVKEDDIVVALGGGAPCHCDNMNLLEKAGEVIYLKVDSEVLAERLKEAASHRPIVLNKSKEELLNYIKDLRLRCEHHYLRAKYIVDGHDLTADILAGIIGAGK